LKPVRCSNDGNRVARHGLSVPTTSATSALAALDLLAGLAEQLEAGAADTLGHLGGHGHRHASVQANVARQEELVKVARRHVAGDDRADVVARHGGALASASRAALMPRSVGEMWPSAPQ
jgi:hypothetical protein